MSASSSLAETRLRALVVDEDPMVRLLVSTVVQELGHEAMVARDVREAWQRMEERRPSMLVLEMELANGAGLELCRRVRAGDHRRDVFIIGLIQRNHPEVLEQVLDAGADEFVVQPFLPEHLRARFVVARRRIAQEAARRAAEEALAQARWLAGIGEATLALQHEINNPLSALLGCAELLMMDSRDKGESNELVDIIHEQAQRIAEVVRRLRKLKDPQSVDYVGGSRMLDLSTGPNS